MSQTIQVSYASLLSNGSRAKLRCTAIESTSLQNQHHPSRVRRQVPTWKIHLLPQPNRVAEKNWHENRQIWAIWRDRRILRVQTLFELQGHADRYWKRFRILKKNQAVKRSKECMKICILKIHTQLDMVWCLLVDWGRKIPTCKKKDSRTYKLVRPYSVSPRSRHAEKLGFQGKVPFLCSTL
jgi:hypothetical protein